LSFYRQHAKFCPFLQLGRKIMITTNGNQNTDGQFCIQKTNEETTPKYKRCCNCLYLSMIRLIAVGMIAHDYVSGAPTRSKPSIKKLESDASGAELCTPVTPDLDEVADTVNGTLFAQAVPTAEEQRVFGELESDKADSDSDTSPLLRPTLRRRLSIAVAGEAFSVRRQLGTDSEGSEEGAPPIAAPSMSDRTPAQQIHTAALLQAIRSRGKKEQSKNL
jgi:hypothetical protein